MAKEGDWYGPVIEKLSQHGPWPLVLLVWLLALTWQLPKIIHALQNFWKVRTETRQKLKHKNIEFEEKMERQRTVIRGAAPSGRKSRQTEQRS
jgi:hypothetical protein